MVDNILDLYCINNHDDRTQTHLRGKIKCNFFSVTPRTLPRQLMPSNNAPIYDLRRFAHLQHVTVVIDVREFQQTDDDDKQKYDERPQFVVGLHFFVFRHFLYVHLKQLSIAVILFFYRKYNNRFNKNVQYSDADKTTREHYESNT